MRADPRRCGKVILAPVAGRAGRSQRRGAIIGRSADDEHIAFPVHLNKVGIAVVIALAVHRDELALCVVGFSATERVAVERDDAETLHGDIDNAGRQPAAVGKALNTDGMGADLAAAPHHAKSACGDTGERGRRRENGKGRGTGGE